MKHRAVKRRTVKHRIRGLSAVAAAFGMFPGFILPFVVSLTFSTEDADSYLITFAVSLTLWNVVVNNLELNTISEVGKRLSAYESNALDMASIRSYCRRSLLYSSAISLPAGAILIILYGLGLTVNSDYLVAGLISILVAIVGSISSVYSGILIANSHSTIAVGTQGIRGSFAVIGCFFGATHGIWIVPAFMLTGEILRFLLLRRVCVGYIGERIGSIPMSLRSVGWQSASTAVAQGAPVIDRAFLTSGSSGAVTAYEMADKIFFALIQFMNLAVLVKLVGRWSLIESTAEDKRRVFVGEGLRKLALVSSISAVLMGGLILLVLQFEILPGEWVQGIHWSLILLACAPFAMLNSAYGRILILVGKQRVLIYFALLSVVSNLVLDFSLFQLFGAVGIVVASAAVKIVSVVAYLAYFRLVGWRVLQEMSFLDSQAV